MWSQRLSKTLAKLALAVPFFALTAVAAQSCGGGGGEPEIKTCHLTIDCTNCKVYGEGSAGTAKIDIERDYGDRIRYTFKGDNDPATSISYNLPDAIEVKIDGKIAGPEEYTYNATTGNFSMLLDAKSVAINALASDAYAVVTFANTGETIVKPQKVEIGGTANEPNPPSSRDGKEFGGWFESASGAFQSPFNFATPIERNITIMARWVEEGSFVTVTFDTGEGGSSVPSQKHRYGDRVIEPPAPSRQGFLFNYWSLDPPKEGGEQRRYVFAEHTVTYYDFTLYARWEREPHNVTFHREGYPADAHPKWKKGTVTEDTRVEVGYDGNSLFEFVDYHGKRQMAITAEPNYDFVCWSHSATEYKPVIVGDIIDKDIDLYPYFSPHPFTITFHGGGGGWITSEGFKTDITMDVPYGETPPVPEPVRRPVVTTRYIFDGYSPELGPVDGEKEYTVQWKEEEIEYYVPIDGNGGKFADGQEVVNIEYTPGETWGQVKARLVSLYPKTPEKIGYTFCMWAWEGQTKEVPDEYIFTKDKPTGIKATYNVNSYPISFDSQGGSAVPGVQVAYGTCVPKPQPDPEKTGHTFLYWYRDDPNTEYDFTKPIGVETDGFTLHALWQINSYTLTFDANGGVIEGETTFTVEYNKLLRDYVEQAEASKTGYEFVGWRYQGTDKPYIDGDTMPAGDTTLVAQYAIKQFLLVYDPNGGEGAQIADWVTYNTPWSKIKETAPTVTYPHHDFKGWSLTKTNQKPVPDDWTMPAVPTTIYAIWELHTYTVTLNGQGGKWGDKETITRNAQFGNKWSKVTDGDTPTKEGYDFQYYTSDSGGTKKIDPATDFNPSIATIYAFYKIKQMTVTFDSQGGSEVKPITTNWNQPIKEPAAPTRLHYQFGGWYKEATCVNKFDFATPIKANITLYAKWAINVHKVTFDPGEGATLVPADSTAAYENIAYNTKIGDLPKHPEKASKTGYTFNYWSVDGVEIKDLANYTTPDDDVTIKANFTINQYTVTFTWDGGSEKVKVNYNETVKPIASPTKEGYTFDDWYADKGHTKHFDFAKTKITGDTTIYGKFNINHYDIILDGNGGKYPSFPFDEPTFVIKNVAYGSSVLEAITDAYDPPTKEGHKFKFHTKVKNDESTKVNSSDKVGAHNLTLYAYYSINSYTVKFDTDGGSKVPSQSVQWNTCATKPADPTKYGFQFDGWYADSGRKTVFDFSTHIKKDTTIYAKWKRIKFNVQFVNYDGTLLKAEQVEYEGNPTPPADPTRPADETYTYAFAGWSPALEKVTKDAVYYATYTPTPINYKITWVYHPTGAESKTLVEDHQYNEELTPPTTVEQYVDGLYVYKFVGWSPTITPVTGAATYTAQYTQELLHYTVTWLNYDLTTLEVDHVLPGELPSYDNPTPEKVDGETGHKFAFKGWDKDLEPVQSDITYVAQFEDTVSLTFEGHGCMVYGSYEWTQLIWYKEDTVDLVVTADYTHALPAEIEVLVEGKPATLGFDYTYDPVTGKIHMSSDRVLGNIQIIVVGREL